MEVSSVWTVPHQYGSKLSKGLILAHGAGNDMENPLISYVHQALAKQGVLSVKFNFPYTEQGRTVPDRTPVLETTWRAVIEAVRTEPRLAPKQLFLGGKSLGGRIASHIVAAGEDCAGLVFLGYPLHPPNNPQNQRAEHLTNIQCPMLFIQGSRDAWCKLDLLNAALKTIKASESLHVIEGGDHSFKVLKRLGRSERDVCQEIVDVISKWLHTWP